VSESSIDEYENSTQAGRKIRRKRDQAEEKTAEAFLNMHQVKSMDRLYKEELKKTREDKNETNVDNIFAGSKLTSMKGTSRGKKDLAKAVNFFSQKNNQ